MLLYRDIMEYLGWIYFGATFLIAPSLARHHVFIYYGWERKPLTLIALTFMYAVPCFAIVWLFLNFDWIIWWRR